MKTLIAPLFALFCFFSPQLLQAEENRPPNIVFLFSDDLTTQAISAYRNGVELPATPNLDRLAKEGMLFENCFCGNSICTPSRASVMTGLHSHKNGIVRLSDSLDPRLPTWPKSLHQGGYSTAIFGKWHMKTKPTGFDHWEVFNGQGNYYNPVLYTAKGNRRIEGHSTDIVTNLALDWLKNRDKTKPFALLIQHKAPHRNWMPGPKELKLYHDVTFPEPSNLFDDYKGRVAAANQKMEIGEVMRMESDLMLFRGEKEANKNPYLYRLTPAQKETFLAAFEKENAEFFADPPTGKALVRWKYQRYMKNYLRCIAGVDRNIGRVLDKLNELHLTENTIVIYCADQGFYLGEHGWFDKRWAYEESLRMPLIVRWPGKVKAGSRCTAMVQNIDFFPTFLAAVGMKPSAKVQGISFASLLKNGGVAPDDWRKTIYYRYVDGGHGVPQHSAIRTNDYKLLHFDHPRNAAEEASIWELFDMKKDPKEMVNLAGNPAYAKKMEEMQKLFWETKKYYDDTDESIWQRNRKNRKRFPAEDYINRKRR